MENAENCFTMYPIHINSSVSCGKGRKYSIENSIENPTFREIKNALLSLNLKFREEENKIHPKESKEKGRFIIEERKERKPIIKNLVNLLKEIRNKKDLSSDKNKMSNNFLNLKPKSKKKSKNN